MTDGLIFAKRNNEDQVGRQAFLSRHPLHWRFRGDDHMQTEVGRAFLSRHPVHRHFRGDDHMQTEVGAGPAMYTPQQGAVMRAHAYTMQLRNVQLARSRHQHFTSGEAAEQALTGQFIVPNVMGPFTPPPLTPAQRALITMGGTRATIGQWPHLTMWAHLPSIFQLQQGRRLKPY